MLLSNDPFRDDGADQGGGEGNHPRDQNRVIRPSPRRGSAGLGMFGHGLAMTWVCFGNDFGEFWVCWIWLGMFGAYFGNVSGVTHDFARL